MSSSSQRGEVSGVGRHDDQRRDAGRRPVVLHAERLDERLQVLAGGVLERQAVAVDHAAVAQREHLDGRHVAADGEADHVDRSDVPAVRGLALGEMADCVEPVPLPGRLFELLLRGGLAHAALQLLLDGTRLAGQELDDAVDDLAVLGRRDRADAGREAAVDVVVEARDARMPTRFRPLARPEAEGAVEDVERLAHLLGRRVGAEVHDAPAVALAGEHHARVLVTDGDRDVRVGLVVAQPHVERRPVALDQALLEMERLALGLGDDDLDAPDAGEHAVEALPGVAAAEVGAHPGAQRLRLPDIQHGVVRVAEQVDAGLRRQRGQLRFEAFFAGPGGGRGHAPSLARRGGVPGAPACPPTDAPGTLRAYAGGRVGWGPGCVGSVTQELRLAAVAGSAEESTQYASYRFGKVDPAWRRLPVEERAAMKEAYAEVVEEWQGRMQVLSYSLVGVRPDADFFFWLLTERYEDLRDFTADLNSTPLAGWLETPYSYLAATLSSKYFERDPKRPPRRVVPRKAPYLVVYPFVKVRPWYALSLEDRRRAMQEHAEIGSRFVTVTNHTTYSFGIDDQEFMTAFECEEPVDFLHLMMTLRETEASTYTERDTPIFVGMLEDVRSLLDSLDGTRAQVEAG